MQIDEIKNQLIANIDRITGKPVIVQADETFSGHASLKLAKDGQPAHVLLYKPVHEPELPYLAAIQSMLALRVLEADDDNRFDLASKPLLNI